MQLRLFQQHRGDSKAPNPALSSNVRGEIHIGDALQVLRRIPDESFQACVTSPPYWGLRDYGIKGQIGAESSLDEYIENLVAVFREMRRTLARDGVFWLNIGDSYTSGGRTWRHADKKLKARGMDYRPSTPEGLKPKDLIGVPWRVAFALQQDGWYLRSDIIWHKPNALPESVKDRPSRVHEYLFLFSRSERYSYDHLAIQERAVNGALKNRRSVWSVNTEAFPEAHFATFPKELIRPCIQASTKTGELVFDPFIGSGTTGVVCTEEGRDFVGIELNPEYVEIATQRLEKTGRVNLTVQPES